MSERRIGITVLRYQESKESTLRLHLWYLNDQPIEPEMVTALRGWDQLRPISTNQRAAVGQLSPSRIFIDIAWSGDLRPPYRRRKQHQASGLTPGERRRQVAVGDRLWQLELWLIRWYQANDSQSSLNIAHHYPEYVSRRITPLQRTESFTSAER